MEKNSVRMLLISYLNSHKKSILLFVIFAILFGLLFYLYSLPADMLLYGALLCAFIGIIFMAVDGYGYYHRHQQMQQLYYQLPLGIENLPAAQDLLEEDYQEIVKRLCDGQARMISEHDRSRSELVDYYTLWVHQIKTPIAAMRLLLADDDSTNNRELSLQLFKIEQYVEMVLQYLRLDGGSDLLFKQYQLDQIVRQAVRKYAQVFVGTRIRLDYQPLDCLVLTDEKWMTFVIEQLLSNALKYTRPGGVVQIKAENQVLMIIDNGIGIAPEDLPRVFERGFTGFNGRQDKKATGLGLYLCQLIIQKLGHRIWLESEPGRGTSVKIDFHIYQGRIE